MIVWSIRSVSELKILETHGRFFTADQKVPDFRRDSYAWMAARLGKQVARPPYINFPVWAWYQWRGPTHPRPDLRVSSHLPRGMEGALIKLDIPEHQLLLSDFQRWHAVLNRHYLPESRRDEERFERALRHSGVKPKWPYPEPFATEVEQSWERIFDLSMRMYRRNYWGPRDKVAIQAVFWEIRTENVIEVRRFHAR